MGNESLTMSDVENVVANAVSWWVSAIKNKSGETTPEQIQKFQSILSSEVQIGLARTGYLTLQTDFYPEEILAKVAHQTFIKGSAFPQKTFMDVAPHEVGVRQNRGVRKLIFAIQKKTKLTGNSDETQMLVDPLTNS